MKNALQRAEWSAGAILSIVAVALHCLAGVSMGALWRDEANTIGLATLPGFGQVWRDLQFDSFPAAWILFVRFLANIAGPMNDTAFRIAGVVIGLLLLSTLWVNARAFKLGAPLLSLSLLALSPSVIRWGDSLRAYGAGMALAVLTGVMIWKFLNNPAWFRFLLASITAIAGVQVLFYNAPVVLSFCIAGVVVTLLRRDYRTSAAVIGIGLLAAGSLLIYLPMIRAAASWNSLATIPDYDLGWFFFKLDEAMSPVRGWTTRAWVLVGLTALWLCIRQVLFKPVALSDEARDRFRFAVAALVAVAISQYAFLKALSYLTQPWYYLTLLAVTAVMVDIVAASLMASIRLRMFRIGLAVIAAAASLMSAARYVGTRMTNTDIAAQAIAKVAGSEDRVLVAPWDFGVSFSRYYRGVAPFTTIPEIAFHTFHRYDLISSDMQMSDQTAPVRNIIEQVRTTLMNGNAVYVVSDGRLWKPNEPVILPPAAIPRDGWLAPKYQLAWMRMIGSELRRHAVTISPQVLHSRTPVGSYENLDLTIVRGWRD